jgi:hypothetical protein
MANGESALDLSAQREAAILEHDPKKWNRFSEKIMRKQNKERLRVKLERASRDDDTSNQKALKVLWKRSTT